LVTNISSGMKMMHRRHKGVRAGCTKRRAVEKGGVGCRKGQPFGLHISAVRWSALRWPCSGVQRSPPACPSVQLASPWKIHVFHLVTWPSVWCYPVLRLRV